MKNAKIAIFASGTGSNAAKIIEYFKENESIQIAAVYTNNKNAAVIELARENQIPVLVFTKDDFYSTNQVLKNMIAAHITHIVLAGFLWLIPPPFFAQYPEKIINIHPALLPRYGGKGMYGIHVHEAIKAANEKETGITIHLINENYDEGKYLAQKSISLKGNESAMEIAQKVQQLEHEHYSKMIEKWIMEMQ